MFRFLVVEDDEPTLMQLKALLSEEFDGSAVDTAGSVAEGNQCLADSVKTERSYDAALLDFNLPTSFGEVPEIDHSLCDAIRSESSRTLVIHMTGWAEDASVRNHLLDGYKELGGPQTLLISKETASWPTVLLAKLRRFLFSREVSRQIDELFGPDASAPSPPQIGFLRHPIKREGGVTYRLAKLTQDIESHWQDLDEDLKRRISEIFVIDLNRDGIRVGLL